MAGGTWSYTDKPVLPGLYLNFQAAALASVQAGERGTVAIPVKAHWGPVRQFVEITDETGLINTYSSDTSNGATAYTIGRLALLGGAKKVLCYRLADSQAAKATLTLKDTAGTNVLKLDAKYEGARGNNFRVTVQQNAIDSTKKDLLLYEGTNLLCTFTFAATGIQNAVDAINNNSTNVWITASKIADGNGTLANITGATFSGGNSGIANITATDYVNYLSALEGQEFNILALDGVSDSAIQTSVVAWIARVREEGKLVMAVLGGSLADDTASDAVTKAVQRSSSFNYEGVINVGVGAVLDGVQYSSAQISAYIAGLIAGQRLNESVTYAVTPFEDVVRRWTRSEMETAVKNGVLLLINDGQKVKVLQGINSLVSLRIGQNNAWKKIRAVRVMDAINTDLLKAAEDNYIGKVNNTEEGRLALIGAFKQYMETLALEGVIEASGWDVYLDPAYYGDNATLTPEPDQVYVKWEARLTDVVEKIFGTFIVK